MDLVNRLKLFMDVQKIGISQFADSCFIPRPTMSQILNGRNKKISDELISKIHSAYPQLNILWLMFGEGDMLAKANIKISEAQNGTSEPVDSMLFADQQHFITGDSSHKSSNENIADKVEQQTVPDFNSSSPQVEANDIRRPYIDFNFGNPHMGNPSSEQISTTGRENSADAFPEQPINTGDYAFERGNSAFKPLGIPSEMQPENTAQTGTEVDNDTEGTDGTDTRQAYTPDLNGQALSAGAADSDGQISIQPCPNKKITNIVVFYSDHSFQSFMPG